MVSTIWNNLLDYAVSPTSLNLFKNSLHEFVHAQDILFNWKADLTGTGDRCENRLY
jgi:hypothetical protein